MRSSLLPTHFNRIAAAILATSLVAGCSDSDFDCLDGSSDNTVAIAARAADYSAGQILFHSLSDLSQQACAPATISDIDVFARNGAVFQIEKFGADTLSRFDDDLSSPSWQYSVNGDETSANPYQIVFESDTRAYLIRYGSPKVWVIDPSATTEANFKTGEIDLSAYSRDGATNPNASAGLLHDGKLYVLMERLSASFVPDLQGYVAVIDIATGAEIDTGQGTADGLSGIALGVNNPAGLQINDANGLIYVLGRGNYFAANADNGNRYTGGVVTIDPETYAASLLIDDGTEEDNSGFFNRLVVADAARGYLLTYASWQNTTLLPLHPTTGTLGDSPVNSLSGTDVTAMRLGPNGDLWVGVNGTTPRVDRLAAADDSVSASFDTELVPINFAFVGGDVQ